MHTLFFSIARRERRPVILGRSSETQQIEHGRCEVGQLAARAKRATRTVTTTGTGLVVWAVNGKTPSSSSIFSALPWSAVIRQTPPPLGGLDDAAEARVGRLDGSRDGRDHAGVTDHVGVGEVDDGEG